MKMNGQESVNGQNNDTKERGVREKAWVYNEYVYDVIVITVSSYFPNTNYNVQRLHQ